VNGRRVIFMGPLDGSDPSREETCDRWKLIFMYHSVYLCSLEVDVKNKTVARPFGTRANKQTNAYAGARSLRLAPTRAQAHAL
jgi:hypothetical protein